MLRNAALRALVLAAPLGTAESTTIVVEFNSSVSYVQYLPVLGLSPAIGAPVTGYFAYDATAPDLAPGDPTTGQFSGVHLVVNIDGHSIVCDLGAAVVYDVNTPNDFFGIKAGTPMGVSPLVIDGSTRQDGYLALNFTDHSGAIITSDALPTIPIISLLQVSNFNLAQTSSFGFVSYDNVTITGVHLADPAISAVDDVGNDQGRQVRLFWERCSFDAIASLRPITQYAIFRQIDSGLKMPHAATATAPMPSEFGKMPAGDWDFMAIVPASGQSSYSAVVPTLCDWTSSDACGSTFFVRAMSPTPAVFFDSGVAGGYSIDNLAPSIPFNLTLSPAGLLAWDESLAADFDYYAIYGSEDAVFGAGDSILGHSTTPEFDAAGIAHDFFHVTVTDFAGNEGPAATIINDNVVATPGALPSRAALGEIWPNPARGMTSIAYELPKPERIDAAVFDAKGRRVRGLGSGLRGAGHGMLAWDGHDDSGRMVASGIYFVRLQVEGEELVGRVLRMR